MNSSEVTSNRQEGRCQEPMFRNESSELGVEERRVKRNCANEQYLYIPSLYEGGVDTTSAPNYNKVYGIHSAGELDGTFP